MLGLAIKIDIAIFVICMTVCCFLALNNPHWFELGIPRDGLTGYNCSVVPSYYHNPQVAKALCTSQGQTIILFSKASTFIFLLLMLTFIFRSAVTVHYPFSKSNILFHLTLIVVIMLFIYLTPQYMHTSYNGL